MEIWITLFSKLQSCQLLPAIHFFIDGYEQDPIHSVEITCHLLLCFTKTCYLYFFFITTCGNDTFYFTHQLLVSIHLSSSTYTMSLQMYIEIYFPGPALVFCTSYFLLSQDFNTWVSSKQQLPSPQWCKFTTHARQAPACLRKLRGQPVHTIPLYLNGLRKAGGSQSEVRMGDVVDGNQLGIDAKEPQSFVKGHRVVQEGILRAGKEQRWWKFSEYIVRCIKGRHQRILVVVLV